MYYVYLLKGPSGYEARVQENIDKFLADKMTALSLGEEFVRLFRVKEKPIADKVLDLAWGFANAHNSGKKPKLEQLVQSVHELIGEPNIS